MSNQIFVSTSSNNYGLIAKRNQLHNNPAEKSQTFYKTDYVTYKLPQTQTYGLINTASDGYGLINKDLQLVNNPPETTGNSKVIVQNHYTQFSGITPEMRSKSYSTV